MDIVSVAAPKRRRRTNPAIDPLFVAETPIDQNVIINVQPTAEESRDIGNWEYRPWHGRDHWYNTKTHRSSFDERFVRKNRHQ